MVRNGSRDRSPAHHARLAVAPAPPPAKNPGEGLVPFVLEALGRPSPEAEAFLRAMAPGTPGDPQRAEALRLARQYLSVTLQSRNAELLLAAPLTKLPGAQ